MPEQIQIIPTPKDVEAPQPKMVQNVIATSKIARDKTIRNIQELDRINQLFLQN